MNCINIIAERDTVTKKFKLVKPDSRLSTDIQDALKSMLNHWGLCHVVINGYQDGHHYVIEAITDIQSHCDIIADDIEAIYECAGCPECITLRLEP